MKFLRLIVIAACAGCIASCAPVQTRSITPVGDEHYSPSNNVEVLDTAPTRAYVKIGDVDATGKPGDVPAQVLAQIRTEAQQMGADAVVLKDVSRTLPSAPRLNPTTGMYETTGGQAVPAYTGIAIRYR